MHVDFWGRSYQNYNSERLKAVIIIIEYNWNQYWNLMDPDDSWELIIQVIESAINPMCPLKKRRARNSNELWLCNGILEATFDRHQAWKLAKIFLKI